MCGLIASTRYAEASEFEALVLVGGDHAYFCSGVVVAPRVVLTAAHCAHATRISRALDAPSVLVSHAAIHPTEDIAVLRVDRDLRIPLHPLRTDATPPITQIAIVGFGVQDPIRVTGFGLKRVRRIMPDGWGCDARRSRELGCRIHTELLLRGGRDNDTCFGDSGGGAFERIDDGWRLIGITSRGTFPKRVVCGEGGVYVRVDTVHEWLTRQGIK